MAEKVAAVVTVEIDERLYAMASEELSEFSNVLMLQVDALKRLQAETAAELNALLRPSSIRSFKGQGCSVLPRMRGAFS